MKRISRPLTHERLKSLYWYDPVVGTFLLKAKIPHDKRKIGDFLKANNNGYLTVLIDGLNYPLHTLAWFYMKKEWPLELIDHIDRNPLNNSILNLRQATNKQNQANKRINRLSSFGLKGVASSGKRYRSRIRIDGHKVHIGTFDSPEEAHAAYVEKEKEVFGEFYCAG